MPLLVDNIPTQAIDIKEFFKAHEDLTNRSQIIVNDVLERPQSLKFFNNEGFVLYVHQREYCVIDPKYSKLQIIGSDEATTCHIILMRHKATSKVLMAHIDIENYLEHWINKGVSLVLINSLAINSNNVDNLFDVWIYGGYLDEKGFSEKITIALLDAMSKCTLAQFNLQILCTGQLNTMYLSKDQPDFTIKSIPIPIITGMAYNIDEKSQQPYPATFLQKGPDDLLRSARNMMAVNANDIIDITPQGDGHDILKFNYLMPKMEMGALYAMLPDDILLYNFSTSPQAESPNFVPRIRKMLKLLNLTPGEESMIRENSIYKMNHETGIWEKM